MNYRKLFITLMVLSLPGFSFAQETASDLESLYSQYQLEIVVGVAAVVAVLALVALITALYALKAMARGKMAQEEESSLISVRPGEEGVSFWRRFWNRLNNSVPIANEETILTDHAYDGIRELDNRLPPWWLYGFYITILFAAIYVLNYHVFKYSPLQEEAYEVEMKKADEAVTAYLASLDNLIDETNVTFLDDQTELTGGQDLFKANCIACHGSDGQGMQGLGPNLTDKYWLHGGDIKDVFKTIKYGVPEKGMVSWKANFTPKQLQQLASFVYSLEGTNPPNPREPQGELFERGAEEQQEEPVEDAGQVIEAGI